VYFSILNVFNLWIALSTCILKLAISFVGISPRGSISFVSKVWGGRASDRHITLNSGFIDLIDHGDVRIMDHSS
jgi:hypothetical protein